MSSVFLVYFLPNIYLNIKHIYAPKYLCYINIPERKSLETFDEGLCIQKFNCQKQNFNTEHGMYAMSLEFNVKKCLCSFNFFFLYAKIIY